MTVTIEWVLEETQQAPEGGDVVSSTYGVLDIDAVVVESYDIGADVTEHPVEEGSDITDHSRPKLNVVSLECAITNQPITSPREHLGTTEAVELELPAVTRITWGAQGMAGRRSSTEESAQSQGVRVLRFEDDFDRCREVFEQLEELRTNGTPIDVIGARFGDLEGYLIVGLSFPVENDNGIVFTLDIKERRTARTQEVDAPSPLIERGRRGRNRGNQPGREGSETRTSAARALVDDINQRMGNQSLLSAGGGS